MASKATSQRKSAGQSSGHKEPNLGQKEAMQQKKSDSELERMGEKSSDQDEGMRSD